MSYLLTEIALEMLGNKIFDMQGRHVRTRFGRDKDGRSVFLGPEFENDPNLIELVGFDPGSEEEDPSQDEDCMLVSSTTPPENTEPIKETQQACIEAVQAATAAPSAAPPAAPVAVPSPVKSPPSPATKIRPIALHKLQCPPNDGTAVAAKARIVRVDHAGVSGIAPPTAVVLPPKATETSQKTTVAKRKRIMSATTTRTIVNKTGGQKGRQSLESASNRAINKVASDETRSLLANPDSSKSVLASETRCTQGDELEDMRCKQIKVSRPVSTTQSIPGLAKHFPASQPAQTSLLKTDLSMLRKNRVMAQRRAAQINPAFKELYHFTIGKKTVSKAATEEAN